MEVIFITDLALTPPPEELQPVGEPSLPDKYYTVLCLVPGGSRSLPSGSGIMYLCNFYIMFVFLADGLLLGLHGKKGKAQLQGRVLLN